MKILVCALSFALTAALTGCVTSLVELSDAQPHPARTNRHTVELLPVPPAKAYKTLATIRVYADYFDKSSVLEEELKRRAAKLGADAVVASQKVERYAGSTSAGSRLVGAAIKYQE